MMVDAIRGLEIENEGSLPLAQHEANYDKGSNIREIEVFSCIS